MVNDAAGTGAGTIDDTGDDSYLYFDNTQTFNNATIALGTASEGLSFLKEYDTTGARAVLTLGSNVTVDVSGAAAIGTGGTGDGIVNQGNIDQTGSGGDLVISGGSFTNSGTITASASGGALYIHGTRFTNSGTLAVSNADTVFMGASNFSNSGSITLASGGSLYLDTNVTLANLGTVSNSGGTIYIEATFNDAGGTLNGSSGLGQAVLYYGTVDGGAATPAGLVFSSFGGTLSGVTYDGALDLSEQGASVNIAGDTVVNNAAGTGAGTIDDTGDSSRLYFDNTQTFNNATINLGGASGDTSYLEEDDTTGAGTVLTLGSNVTIDESGIAQIETGGDTGDGIVNQGNISQTASGAYLAIYGNSFTNSGTIAAASSGAMLVDPAAFANSGTLAVSNGGAIDIEATTASLGGATSGAGTLELIGGSATIASGATLSVSNWSVNNSDVTLDEDLTYAGTFIAGPSGATGPDIFVLSGGSLVLTGDDTFTVGTVEGSNSLKTEGTTAVSGLTIGGTVEWENAGTATESGETVTVTIGDSSGDEAELFNSATGTYDIVDDSGIDRGSSTASYIRNAGLFEKTGGTGTSAITPAVANSGTLEAASGTLEFKGAVTGAGTDEISGRATLEFYSTVAAGQTVSFAGSGGELLLHDPAGFAGSISGFDMAAGSNDTIRVASPWHFTGFTENANGMEGTLGFSNGSSTLSLTLIGDYNANDFVHKTGPRGSTLITYT
jgi:fibronectin-binding autotransporter adhesin